MISTEFKSEAVKLAYFLKCQQTFLDSLSQTMKSRTIRCICLYKSYALMDSNRNKNGNNVIPIVFPARLVQYL